MSHYQLLNIPCPRFDLHDTKIDRKKLDWLDRQLNNTEFDLIEKELLDVAAQHGCAPTLQDAIARLIRFIETEEEQRGRIARAARSALSENAERCQVVLDKLLLALLGLDADSYEYLKSRLEQML